MDSEGMSWVCAEGRPTGPLCAIAAHLEPFFRKHQRQGAAGGTRLSLLGMATIRAASRCAGYAGLTRRKGDHHGATSCSLERSARKAGGPAVIGTCSQGRYAKRTHIHVDGWHRCVQVGQLPGSSKRTDSPSKGGGHRYGAFGIAIADRD